MDHRDIAPAPRNGVADTPWRLAAVVGLLVFLSRLPFLGHGYGSDADGWRAMLAAQHFLSSGHYVPSRPPGYPIPEFFDALMLWLGLGDSWWVSLGTALMSGLTAFWLLPAFLPLGREKALPLSLAFAFTPVVFVASLGAMDYLWASAFFLAATWCAWRGRLLGAAVLLGLAAACRPTYALGYIPLALMLIDLRLSSLRTRETWRKLIVLAAVSGGLTLAFFVPALLEIGATVFKMPPQHPPSVQQLVFIPTVGVFGSPDSLSRRGTPQTLDDLAKQVMRIVEESVANTIKYAGASRLAIRMSVGALTTDAAIDRVIQVPLWDTIDMVKHDGHLYSSKPPLFPTLLRTTGAGFCFNTGRILASPVLFWLSPWMKSTWDLRTAITCLGGFFLFGVVILKFLPETQGEDLPE